MSMARSEQLPVPAFRQGWSTFVTTQKVAQMWQMGSTTLIGGGDGGNGDGGFGGGGFDGDEEVHITPAEKQRHQRLIYPSRTEYEKYTLL